MTGRRRAELHLIARRWCARTIAAAVDAGEADTIDVGDPDELAVVDASIREVARRLRSGRLPSERR